jgi:hypothetical protein
MMVGIALSIINEGSLSSFEGIYFLFKLLIENFKQIQEDRIT